MPEVDHKFKKFKQLPVFLKQTPVQPRDLVVLAVRIVVAELGVAELVPCQEHGRSPAAHKHCTGVAYHPEAQLQHLPVAGASLHAAVPAAVVVGAVLIVPAILLIVLHIVGVQIIQCKTVMAGEEIHTGIVACIIIVVVGVKSPVQVPGAGNAPGCLPGMPVVPFEIPPEGIPVTAVPLRPALAGRKLPHLVQPPCIPGLRNQLYIAQYGIGGQKLQKGRAVQRGTVLMPPQNAGQVEAEAVDAVAHRPVPQAFQDQLPHNGIIAVQSVAAPAEIVIMPLGSQHIVHFVVKALEAECGASLVALRRMIEHHIQNNLNTVVVERLDQ